LNEIFPAVPQSWGNVSFNSLRTEGAFLVSAKKENGVPAAVKVFAEKGGTLRIKLPFKTFIVQKEKPAITVDDTGTVTLQMNKEQTIIFENGYE